METGAEKRASLAIRAIRAVSSRGRPWNRGDGNRPRESSACRPLHIIITIVAFSVGIDWRKTAGVAETDVWIHLGASEAWLVRCLLSARRPAPLPILRTADSSVDVASRGAAFTVGAADLSAAIRFAIEDVGDSRARAFSAVARGL
jgi:hypothetical protein